MTILAATDIDAFYQAIASVSFVLAGLWWVAAQIKYEEWRADPVKARHAYGIAMYFVLPGLMAMMASVNSDISLLWRLAFGLTAALGVLEAVLYLRTGGRRSGVQLALRVAGGAVYLLILIVAIRPRLAADLGLSLKPREVEAVLLTVLLFLAANIAWFGLIESSDTAGA